MQRVIRAIAERVGRDSWPIRLLRPVYELALDMLSLRRGVSWSINGSACRISPYVRHLVNPLHEQAVATFLRDRVKSGQLLIDVGANVGQYILQFADWSSPDGRVIAFEPSPASCHVLSQHIAMNSLSTRVKVVRAAVGEHKGYATLFTDATSSVNRLGSADSRISSSINEIRVPVMTLDDFCESEHVIPDWLLIDIEGFEIKALLGAMRLLRRCKGRIGVVIEFHPDAWSVAETSVDQARRLLGDIGVTPIALTGQRDLWTEYGVVYLSWIE